MATPITYISSITGDCSNLGQGAITVEIQGGTPPYTIDWTTPNLGSDSGVTTSTRTGLTAGAYVIQVTDSTSPDNQIVEFIVYVSDGLCVTIIDEQDANCGNEQGSITAYATSTTNIVSYDLYQYDPNTGTSVLVASSSNNYFPNLPPGVYYVVACDEGGCTGSTGTCIIQNGINFDFGLYVVQPSSCLGGSLGAIYVTGLTGTPPYSYVWSTNEISSFISGITAAGSYSVTVTDNTGCSKTKSVYVDLASPLAIISFTNTSPTCFNSDGQIIVNISGGSPPYYYQFSNGYSEISFLSSLPYGGIPAGHYEVSITDAALCVVTGATDLVTVGSFVSIEVSKKDANCGNANGSVLVTTIGGGGATQIEIINPDSTYSVVTSTSHNFNALSAGTYFIVVSNGTSCVYTEEITILDLSPFTASTIVNDSYCGINNGSIQVTLNPAGEYLYQIDSSINTIYAATDNYTFSINNISPGYHVLYVNKLDLAGACVVEVPFVIRTSENPQLALISTSCGSGSEGEITAIITGGIPPYTFNWSSNVDGQTGVFVTGLSAGNYSLTITDSAGCKATNTTSITCRTARKPRTSSADTTYTLFTVCENTFTEEPGAQLGIFEMYYDGYLSVLSGRTNCTVPSATYTIQVIVDGVVYTSVFYVSSGPTDIPSDYEYIVALQNLLSTIPGLGAIIFDEATNTFILNSDCENTPKHITIKLKIEYQVCCNSPIKQTYMCVILSYFGEIIYYTATAASDVYNDLPYYRIYDNGVVIGYIYFDVDINEWVFAQGLGIPPIFAILQGGPPFEPLSSVSGNWECITGNYCILETLNGKCKPTTTTTTSSTGTTTSTTFTGTTTSTTFTGTTTTTSSTGTTTSTTFTGTTTTTTISGVCYCYVVHYIEATTTTTTWADCHCVVVTYNATTQPTTSTTTFADCHCVVVTYHATTSTTSLSGGTTTTSTTISGICYCYSVYFVETTSTTQPTTTTTVLDCYCYGFMIYPVTTTTSTIQPLTTTTTILITSTTTQPITTTTSSVITSTTTQPITTTTSRVITSTTTCPCYSGQVTVTQTMINNAIGNNTYPNNTVFFDMTWCNKQGVLYPVNSANIYTFCFDSRYVGNSMVYYYVNDIKVNVTPTPIVYTPTDCCTIITPPSTCECYAVQNNNFEGCFVNYYDCSTFTLNSTYLPGSGQTTFMCSYGPPFPSQTDTACVNDIFTISLGYCEFGACTGVTTTIPITYYEWNVPTCSIGSCSGGQCLCQGAGTTLIYTGPSINTLAGVYTAGPNQLFSNRQLTNPLSSNGTVYLYNASLNGSIYQYTDAGGSQLLCNNSSPCP